MTTDDEIREFDAEGLMLNIKHRERIVWINLLANDGTMFDPSNPLHIRQVQKNFEHDFGEMQTLEIGLYPFMFHGKEAMKGPGWYNRWRNFMYAVEDLDRLAQWLHLAGEGKDPMELQRQKLREQREAGGKGEALGLEKNEESV